MESERVVLTGLDGSNPLAFLAALGVLRVLEDQWREGGRDGDRPRLGWTDHGGRWRPVVSGGGDVDAIVHAVVEDRVAMESSLVLRFFYPKVEKSGPKQFAGLAPPVAVGRAWLTELVGNGTTKEIAYGASLFCESATADVKNPPEPEQCAAMAVATTADAPLDKACAPCFFDFTSRNAQFLDQVRIVATQFTADDASAVLARWSTSRRTGRTMGWDPLSEAPGALFSSGREARLYSVAEWLAFRGLPFFILTGKGSRSHMTACDGRRKAGTFRWPLWQPLISAVVVRPILGHPAIGAGDRGACAALGVAQVLEVDLMKTADGYNGAFSPTRPV